MMTVDYEGDSRDIAGSPAETRGMAVVRLAAAVVVSGDRVLLVRRSKTERFLPRVWGVPCGKVDPGESASVAALRELREETGLAGSVVCPIGQSTFSSVWRGRPAENVQSNFLVHPLGGIGKISLPKEDQEAAWVHRDEIDRFDGLDAYNRSVLEQWLSRTEFRQLEPVSSAAIASSRRR